MIYPLSSAVAMMAALLSAPSSPRLLTHRIPVLRRSRYADRGSYVAAFMARYQAPQPQAGTSLPECPRRRAINQTRPRSHVVRALRSLDRSHRSLRVGR